MTGFRVELVLNQACQAQPYAQRHNQDHCYADQVTHQIGTALGGVPAGQVKGAPSIQHHHDHRNDDHRAQHAQRVGHVAIQAHFQKRQFAAQVIGELNTTTNGLCQERRQQQAHDHGAERLQRRKEDKGQRITRTGKRQHKHH